MFLRPRCRAQGGKGEVSLSGNQGQPGQQPWRWRSRWRFWSLVAEGSFLFWDEESAKKDIYANFLLFLLVFFFSVSVGEWWGRFITRLIPFFEVQPCLEKPGKVQFFRNKKSPKRKEATKSLTLPSEIVAKTPTAQATPVGQNITLPSVPGRMPDEGKKGRADCEHPRFLESFGRRLKKDVHQVA